MGIIFVYTQKETPVKIQVNFTEAWISPIYS